MMFRLKALRRDMSYLMAASKLFPRIVAFVDSFGNTVWQQTESCNGSKLMVVPSMVKRGLLVYRKQW
jgi:hypothetical protein